MNEETNGIGDMSSKKGMIMAMTEDKGSFDAWRETLNACRYLITLCHRIEINFNETGSSPKSKLPGYMKHLANPGEASKLRIFLREGMDLEAERISRIVDTMEKAEGNRKSKPRKPKRIPKGKIYKPSDECLKRIVYYAKKLLRT